MSRVGPRLQVAVLAVAAVLAWLGLRLLLAEDGPLSGLLGAVAAFTTLFFALFFQSAPFLLLGTLASGLVEVFVDAALIARWLPRRALPRAFAGALLGFLLPVGQPGVVPLARRLLLKGLPAPAAVAFLLAAPFINPIALAGTLAAFGLGPVFVLRLGLTLCLGLIAAWVFSTRLPSLTLLRPTRASLAAPGVPGPLPAGRSPRARAQQALALAAAEFLDLAVFLILGAALAALVQLTQPSPAVLAIGAGPVPSVLLLALHGAVLAASPVLDAFVAASYQGVFGPGPLLAFLVVGPLVNFVSGSLYLGVFRRSAVLLLLLLPVVVGLAAAVIVSWLGVA